MIMWHDTSAVSGPTTTWLTATSPIITNPRGLLARKYIDTGYEGFRHGRTMSNSRPKPEIDYLSLRLQFYQCETLVGTIYFRKLYNVLTERFD